MKKTLPIIVFLLASLPLFSQIEFAPTGATWSYSYETFWTNFHGFFLLKYEKDTVLNNYSCKKLHASIRDSAQVEVYQQDYFIRQSADSIYLEHGGLGFSIFLFKTQYQVGETTEFDYLWNSPLSVTATENLTFNGLPTQKYSLASIGGADFQTVIYDRFGPELGFFQSWWGVAVDGESFRLLCYQDDEFPLVELGNGPCFGLTPTLVHEPETNNLTVYPNPTHHSIRFDLGAKNATSMNVQVASITGQVVLKTTLSPQQSLDVSGLPKGMYIGSLVTNGLLHPFKFTKQ